MTFRERCRGALLAVPPGLLLSHVTAAKLHDVPVPWDHRVHLLSAESYPLTIPGTVLHRTRELLPEHRANLRGLAVTSFVRTTLDLASSLSDFQLATMVEAALKASRQNFKELEAGSSHFEGGARVRAILSELRDVGVADSLVEGMLGQLALHVGQAPVKHFAIDIGRHVPIHPDLCWPQIKLVVESDSVAYHSDRRSLEEDRARDRELQRRGWVIYRYMASQILDPRRRERIFIELTHLVTERARQMGYPRKSA